jgi:Tfp pilus assembly protein PilF
MSALVIRLIVSLTFTGCAALPAPKMWHDPLTIDEHLVLAGTYVQQGAPRAAAREYEAIVKREPRHTAALVALGNLAVEQHEWTEAETYYRQALEIDPNHVGAANNLATVYLSTGKQLDEAERLARHALEQPGPLKAYVSETLATVYVKQQRWREAEAALDTARSAGGSQHAALQARLSELRQHIDRALTGSGPERVNHTVPQNTYPTDGGVTVETSLEQGPVNPL